EARASADLSLRVVTESSKDTRSHGPSGAATANTSILAEELFYGDERLDDVEPSGEIRTEVGDDPALTDAERAELAYTEARQTAALADIEEALAEYDGIDYGMLRTQSAA